MNDLVKFKKTIGQRIKRIRKSRNLNQEEFGSLIGVSKQYISSLEKGNVNLTTDKYVEYAEAFGINPYEFFIDDYDETKEVIDKFNNLDERNKAVVVDMLNIMSKQS